MKTKLITLATNLGILTLVAGAELKWLTDFEEGQKVAAETNKPLLVNFTGSDWCHWCIQLKGEVFDEESFTAVEEDYVLVELDFPKDEKIISPEQRGKNEALAHRLEVRGFPTVILFEPKGRPFARTGYHKGGPKAYLEHLDEISKPFRNYQSAEGPKRRDALVTFLRTLPEYSVVTDFQEELEELKTLDPNDETQFLSEINLAKALLDFEQAVGELLTIGDFDSVLSLVDDFIEEYQPDGEQKQHVYMARVMAHVEQREKEKAFAEIDAMVEMAPGSEFSQNADQVKQGIIEHLAAVAELAAEEQRGREELPMAEEKESANDEPQVDVEEDFTTETH